MIMLLIPTILFQLQSATFDPSQFKNTRFAAFETSEDAEVPKGQHGLDTSMQGLMAIGTPSGKERPLSAERRDFITKVGTALGNPTLGGRAPLYVKELEVLDGARHTWVTVTAEDANSLETKYRSHTVDLAVRNLGSLAHGASREHLYLLINFRGHD